MQGLERAYYVHLGRITKPWRYWPTFNYKLASLKLRRTPFDVQKDAIEELLAMDRDFRTEYSTDYTTYVAS